MVATMAMSEDADRRIRQLVDARMQALAEGRAQDAARLLRQARAEAPGNPLVMSEMARELLEVGNAAGAIELLEAATTKSPAEPSLWLTKAAALHKLNRFDEEMAALDRTLALNPRELWALLQKGALLEARGDARGAAQSFRNALRSVPPGVKLPAPMIPMLQRAQQAADANNRALEQFLEARLEAVRQQHAREHLDRADQCLATLLQKQLAYRSMPSFLYFPRIPAIEFHDRCAFPWLDDLEAATADIRREAESVLAEGPGMLEPYVSHPGGNPNDPWKHLNNSRRWGVFYLWRESVPLQQNIARCPRTARALESWPAWDIPGSGPTAMFSVLEPRTRIPPHCGVSNARLVVHLPLIVPERCGFRVGAQRREWHPGKAFIFDDTIEHEAWNDSDSERIVFIVDIWNPNLSSAERDYVRTITSGIGEYYGPGTTMRET
jgi:aspartyl/asparaginyl beta-hydroxylase (cupin superfamily)